MAKTICIAAGSASYFPRAMKMRQAIIDNSGESLSRAIGAGFEARATASRATAVADVTAGK